MWVPIGFLPREVGYVRLDSRRYRDWQVIAYGEANDKALSTWERKLYDEWLAHHPPAVDIPDYPTPKQLLRYGDREVRDSDE
ncbi:hypothetical protein PI125_g15856 [Phytophthora idaei]|nr:hypothetical protein PI125_g15856 [Phytophthora idaei]KAG3132054.1 hypothetical protein PI126_g19796 [Phytophthora idaei]